MTAELTLAEATHLAHAVAARAMATEDIRVLFVKGPVAVSQGLRTGGLSSDVDILCDPARVRDAIDLVHEYGWTRYSGEQTDAMAIGMHATAFTIPGWPPTIDLHANFPGMLADPQSAFERLWAAHRIVRLAHHNIPAPAPADHFVILALHALRTLAPGEQTVAMAPLKTAWASLDPRERQDVVTTARETGALEPLREVLIELGAEPGPADDRFSTALAQWRRSREHVGDSAVVWLTRWEQARWRERPELVWRAFWDISMDNSRSPQEWELATRRERALGRLRRARRGLAGVPRAINGRRGKGS